MPVLTVDERNAEYTTTKAYLDERAGDELARDRGIRSLRHRQPRPGQRGGVYQHRTPSP
ncbi:MAG: hypothetical protein U1F77_07040 [Kiritimatiellia bacterium]